MIAFSVGPFVITAPDTLHAAKIAYMSSKGYRSIIIKDGETFKHKQYIVRLKDGTLIIRGLFYTMVYPAPDGWEKRSNGLGQIPLNKTPKEWRLE